MRKYLVRKLFAGIDNEILEKRTGSFELYEGSYG